MDENKLWQLAEAFARELQTSKELQAHMAEHQRRSQRAWEMLTLERIPSLTEDDLCELFSDSDSFSLWFLRDKERGFNARLQKFGIDGLRNALRELVARGERGLTSDDLRLIWEMRGLGILLSTELLTYRFPTRYWTYSPNVTLLAFQKLGEDIKAAMPRGEKSAPYIYLALQPRMAKVCQALRDAGLSDADYLVADIFLWWVKQGNAGKIPEHVADAKELAKGASRTIRYWKISAGRSHKKWPEFRDQSIIAVDLEGSTDLRDFAPQSSADLQAKLRASGIQATGPLQAGTRALWTFYHEIQPEDHVYAYVHKGLAAWGIVKGDYYFAADAADHRHRRSVSWEGVPERPVSTEGLSPELRDKLRQNQTIIELTPEEGEAIETLFGPSPRPESQDVLTIISRDLAAQSLHFTPWQLATFYTALQTKGFVILSGISGTGKTKLAQYFAKMLPQSQEDTPDEGSKDNYLFVSVRPDWRDSKSLLGYYNPLIGTYEWTDFLRFLLRAERNYRSENPSARFVILDEMNLAHAEYYFADLLSVLESGRDEQGWTREPLRLNYPAEAQGDLPPHELRLPPNLYIVGTVNVDETTQAFSPKVLDRAFTLELTEADFSAYPPVLDAERATIGEGERQAILKDFSNGGAFAQIDKDTIGAYVQEHPEVRERLQRLNELLRPHDLHFGYRVFDEIVSFLAAAERNGLYEDLGGAEAAFDASVLMKVLPKFHGSRGKLEAALKKMLAWCLNSDQPALEAVEESLQAGESAGGSAAVEVLAELSYTYPQTASRVVRLLRALYETGFAAFA